MANDDFSDPRLDLSGTSLGGYRLLKEIGAGSTARVYLAVSASSEREVALKVFPLVAATVQPVQRFLREMQVHPTLVHPNIVPTLETGCAGEYLYIAMPFLMGGTLQMRLQPTKSLSVRMACTYGLQILLALAYAHDHQIIHRDIKPANLLFPLPESENVVVADFGLARHLPDPRITNSRVTLGTPNYISPEQVLGYEVTPGADIYALGCVIYEMLAGRPPFIADTMAAMYFAHCMSLPIMLHRVNPNVTKGLALIIDRAMAKKPEDRFLSARVFAEALAPFTSL